jgi:chaperonin GroES
MRLKPVNDKIVVKPQEKKQDEVTESGIILPDSVEGGTLEEGTVVAVGDGMYSANGELIPVVVDEGDVILYGKHGGRMEHKIDGETYIIMSVNEVVSIVKEKE